MGVNLREANTAVSSGTFITGLQMSENLREVKTKNVSESRRYDNISRAHVSFQELPGTLQVLSSIGNVKPDLDNGHQSDTRDSPAYNGHPSSPFGLNSNL